MVSSSRETPNAGIPAASICSEQQIHHSLHICVEKKPRRDHDVLHGEERNISEFHGPPKRAGGDCLWEGSIKGKRWRKELG